MKNHNFKIGDKIKFKDEFSHRKIELVTGIVLETSRDSVILQTTHGNGWTDNIIEKNKYVRKYPDEKPYFYAYDHFRFKLAEPNIFLND